MTAALLLVAIAALIPVAPRPAHRWPELAAARTAAPPTASTARRTPLTRRILDRIAPGRGAPTPVQLLDAAAALDLLAACLAAGMAPGDAASATASAAPDRLAAPLRDVAGRLALGVTSPWAALADTPELADVASLARRSADSGASMAAGIAGLAESRRASAGDAAEATAERAGVLIAGPLALCFLPAFIVIGLVPTIAGLAQTMLGGIAGTGG